MKTDKAVPEQSIASTLRVRTSVDPNLSSGATTVVRVELDFVTKSDHGILDLKKVQREALLAAVALIDKKPVGKKKKLTVSDLASQEVHICK